MSGSTPPKGFQAEGFPADGSPAYGSQLPSRNLGGQQTGVYPQAERAPGAEPYGYGSSAHGEDVPSKRAKGWVPAVVLSVIFVVATAAVWFVARGEVDEDSSTRDAVAVADSEDDAKQPDPSDTAAAPAPAATKVPTTPVPTRPTAAPTSPPTPTTSVTGAGGAVFGDLDVGVPMRKPACDSQFIIIVASSITPEAYRREVSDKLAQFPGSAYLRTDQTCTSLRADYEGNPIYVVYYGPFPTFVDACDVQRQVGGDSYPKALDNISDPNNPLAC